MTSPQFSRTLPRTSSAHNQAQMQNQNQTQTQSQDSEQGEQHLSHTHTHPRDQHQWRTEGEHPISEHFISDDVIGLFVLQHFER